MKRKKKSFKRPKKPFEKGRIDEENKLKTNFGLKNKTELWKALAKVNYFRGRAKALAQQPLEEQEVFFNKLKALGLKVETTSDVLDLKVEDLLKRRLPTIVKEKGLSTAVKKARQMVVHKKILIDGKITNSPSYFVKVSEENLITVKLNKKKPNALKSPKGVDEERGSSSKGDSEIVPSPEPPKEEAPATEQTTNTTSDTPTNPRGEEK
jgi:small subunit ribosomal protein S4